MRGPEEQEARCDDVGSEGARCDLKPQHDGPHRATGSDSGPNILLWGTVVLENGEWVHK